VIHILAGREEPTAPEELVVETPDGRE